LDFSRQFINLIFLWGCLAVILACVLLFRRSHNQTSMVNSGKELVMAEQFIETDKLDSIGELATGIAHEINNPVAIMVEEAGWVQDLIHEGIDKNDNLEEFIRALKQIETQGRRCKEITRKLLSFGRKTDLKIEKIQLNELIEEVVSLSAEKARHANIKIHTQLDPTLPEIQASVTEMQQVLANIINNGLDAMEKKGDRMDISSKLHEDQIIITFRDNGPGINAINLNRVFDPFFSTKPVGKGSGLGLSICYSIIKKMGGRIDFESVLGEGSAFHVVLPTGLFKQ
jgi:two-component system, NtrC family, sensor kinase